MEKNDWNVLLAGRRRLALGGGHWLRVLTAMELLEARRESETMGREGREAALCANACLLARALEKGEKPLFSDGETVLRGMTATEIEALARRWAEFSWAENPAPEDGEGRVEALKKAWSTRRTPGFGGVCSWLLARFPQRHGRGR